ncbi:MAG: glycosyltransferase [Planctomycetes bacterium]|nr:glycosyltransferase [Planctomycetota bacterium]
MNEDVFRMKLMMFVHGYPEELAGGTERHVAASARALVTRGHEVVVVAGTLAYDRLIRVSETWDAGVRVLRVRRDDVYLERWDKRYHPGVSDVVRGILDVERPDVVHVHHWFRLTSDLVRRATAKGVPAVVTLHDDFSNCPTIFRLLPDGTSCPERASAATCSACLARTPAMDGAEFESAVGLYVSDFRNELRRASRILTLSAWHASLVEALGPAHGDVSCGARVSEHPFAAPWSYEPGPVPLESSPLHVGCWGYLTPDKGQDVLLQAVARMEERNKVHVHVFGRPDRPETLERLEALARGSSVTFHGAFDASKLQNTPLHLAVFPTRHEETYGLTLDEAFALGLPVLASDVPSFRERIGNAGHLFPRGDADALAALLSRLLHDPEERAALRHRIQPPTTFDRHLDAIESIYEAARTEGVPDRPDTFDVDGHLRHEFRRFDVRERWILEKG